MPDKIRTEGTGTKISMSALFDRLGIPHRIRQSLTWHMAELIDRNDEAVKGLFNKNKRTYSLTEDNPLTIKICKELFYDYIEEKFPSAYKTLHEREKREKGRNAIPSFLEIYVGEDKLFTPSDMLNSEARIRHNFIIENLERFGKPVKYVGSTPMFSLQQFVNYTIVWLGPEGEEWRVKHQ